MTAPDVLLALGIAAMFAAAAVGLVARSWMPKSPRVSMRTTANAMLAAAGICGGLALTFIFGGGQP